MKVKSVWGDAEKENAEKFDELSEIDYICSKEKSVGCLSYF